MKNILYIILLFQCISLYAQTNKKIEILSADSTLANSIKHPNYLRLINNVAFKHNNTLMYCDSAYHFLNKNKIIAFGKVIVNKGDSIKLTGKKLTYFSSDNKAEIIGNVILIDKYITLRTEKIIYNLGSNIAIYPSEGTIIDDVKSIKSLRGEYNANRHNFIFTDSVTISGKDYEIFTDNMHYNSKNETAFFFGPTIILSEKNKIYCENGWYNTKTNISKFYNKSYIISDNLKLIGDSIFYNQDIGYGQAFENVQIIDTIDNITIFGNLAEYFVNEEYFVVSENPLSQILDENDTIITTANKFIFHQKKNKQRLIAFNNVNLYQLELQAKCDSMCYDINTSRIELFSFPILWIDNFQITSDSIDIFINKKRIKKIFLRPNPIIISQVDTNDYNQIKGNIMYAYFNKNLLSKIDIKGNGESIFILSDENTNDKIGLNNTKCSNMSLYFKQNKLESINYKLKPNSITIPYLEVENKHRYLTGFNWRESERKKK